MADHLTFSLARLAAPHLDLETPAGLHFSLEQDLVHDGLALQRSNMPSGMPALAASDPLGFAGRVQLDGCAAARQQQGGTGGGLLALPQAFGAVYLGQAFAALVAVSNFSEAPVTVVGVKVELSTERSKQATVLYDSSSQPLAKLGAGQRQDFILRHDIKDQGVHSLTCSATYVGPDGERHQQSQAFQFSSLNPLVVRTKQRQAGDAVLLEASLENATKDPMLLDAVTFFPSAAYSAERLGGGGASTLPSAPPAGSAAAVGAAAGPLSSYIQSLPLVPEGCSSAFLFRLTKPASTAAAAAATAASVPASPGSTAAAAAAAAAEASGALGKIEIRWRGPMGEMARLQTQTISLPPPQGSREVSLGLARLPQRVVVGAPFTATLRVHSLVDRRMGPLKIAATSAEQLAPAGSPARTSSARRASGEPVEGLSTAPAAGGLALSRAGTGGGGGGVAPAAAALSLPLAAGAAAVCLDGPQSVLISELPPRQAVEIRLNLLALAAGQQALPALALSNERDGKLYSFLPPVELFVESC